MTSKITVRPLATLAPQARRPDGSKQLTSANISEHMAAFEASGGRVEVLGTTQVLKHVMAPPAPAPTAAKPSRTKSTTPA